MDLDLIKYRFMWIGKRVCCLAAASTASYKVSNETNFIKDRQQSIYVGLCHEIVEPTRTNRHLRQNAQEHTIDFATVQVIFVSEKLSSPKGKHVIQLRVLVRILRTQIS